MNRKKAGAAVGLAALLIGGQAWATPQQPPVGIVWYVLDQLNGLYLDIDDPTNRPALLTAPPADVLGPVDVSPDGVPDWRIDWPQEQPFCGTGGCQRTLYVSAGDHFVRAFDRQAFELTLKRVNGEVRVEAWVHDVYCRIPSADCRFTWRWDAASEALVPLPDQPGDVLASVDPDFRAETPR